MRVHIKHPEQYTLAQKKQ